MLRTKKGKTMISRFNVSNGLVFGQVAKIASPDYFFVQNGDPQQIFCHKNQGGKATVTSTGEIFLDQSVRPSEVATYEDVVLVRQSVDPSNRNFTKACSWMKSTDWNQVNWAVNAKKRYRAIAFNHRNNGQVTSNPELILIENNLIDIINKAPRSSQRDPYLSGYSTQLTKNIILSYDVRWVRLEGSHSIIECADPRPL